MQRDNFWRRVDSYSPILVRLMARHPKGKAISTSEIATKSGLAVMTVYCLSEATSWVGVDIYMLKAFTSACGMDFTSRTAMKRADVFLKGRVVGGKRIGPQFLHLKRDPIQWKHYLQPLLQKFLDHLNQPYNEPQRHQ